MKPTGKLTTTAGFPVVDNQNAMAAGAADAERDIRGFAVKFYTEEGYRDN